MMDPTTELIEVVVHSAEYRDPTIPTDDEREDVWIEINKKEKVWEKKEWQNTKFGCEQCCYGNMEEGKPHSCSCFREEPPMLAALGEKVVWFFRRLFTDSKNCLSIKN